MSTHLPPDQPGTAPPRYSSLDALISRTRALRGELDAVRRTAAGAGAPRKAGADARAERRWQQAVCELAVSQLDDLGGQLHQLRDGVGGKPAAPEAPGTAEPAADRESGTVTAYGAVPPASLVGRVGSADWNLLTDEVTWSEELYLMFGRTEADGPLSLDELPAWVLSEDTPALTAAVTACLVDGRPVDEEFRVRRPDGSVRTLHMTGEPVLGDDGDTSSMWAVLRDVSALRRTEHAVRESRETLRTERRRAQAERRFALELRETVLPPWRSPLALPRRRAGSAGTTGRLELAAHHLPSASSQGTGGTWHEASELPDGTVLLGTGELTGNGVAAAAAVAGLLGAVRGLSLAGLGPAALVGHLNQLVDGSGQPSLGSALCAHWDASTLTLRWAQAGHPPPLLFRGGTGRALQRSEGMLLGVTRGARYEQREERLRPGDLVVLHTEGLPVNDGTDVLDLAPRFTVARDPQECVRALAEEFGGGGGRESDACVLVARVSG